MNTITLIQPLIPHNTGCIARLCVVTNTKLHLVGELGFELSDKYLKRAGLDYWKDLQYEHFIDIDDYFSKFDFTCGYLFSTKTSRHYTDIQYPVPTSLVFGNETEGTPLHIQKHFENNNHVVRFPMHEHQRCINLSVSAGIGLYEVLRQQNFMGLH